MQIAKMVIAVLFVYLVLTQMPFAATAQTESDKQASGGLSFLHTEGQKIVDDNRKAVHLHGVNVGGWLLIEPWIIDAEMQEGIVAEKDIWDFKGRREPFTVEESRALRQTFRDNWFTEDDVKKIAAAGLNSVRLPIWWRAINNSDEEYGGGLEYIDNCIEWCNNSSLYVILDLHGAPGGQNKIGKNTGEQTNADLWNNETFRNQTVDWWRTIAERYKNESTVAGYDILNEADGNLSTKDDFEDMIILYDKIYDAIRDVEKHQKRKHIIILEAGMLSQDLPRMPMPKDKGWENVVYSFHYHLTNCTDPYEAQSVFFSQLQAIALQYDVPIYVGEFNTMQIGISCDPPYENLNISQRLQLLETYSNIFDYYDWSWAFWTYKTIERNHSNNWGLYGYVNDTPTPDFNKDSYKDINDSFKLMRTEIMGKNYLAEIALKNTSCWESPKEQFWDGADLTMQNAVLLRPRNSGLKVEWNCPLPNAGNWSEGDSISWKFNVNVTDLYEVTLYSSSNKSTGNIVSVWIDGVLAAEIPIEFSGGWDRYVNNSLGKYNLDAGDHTLAISQSGNDNAKDFLNLRSVSLRRSSGHASSIIGSEIDLNAANFASIQPNSTLIRIDWQAKPWTFGNWNQKGKVVWDTHLDQSADRPATYDINIEYATPNNETTLIVGIDGKEHPGYKLDGTVDWANYRWYNDTISIQEIKDNISIMWKPGVGTGDVGNLRRINFVRQF